MNDSFKESVRKSLINNAKRYKKNFLDTEYIIYSSQFEFREFYNITGYEDNYLHLSGVNTNLKSSKFYEKCINNTLEIEDFEIKSKKQKGSVRRKINVLSNSLNIFFEKHIFVEEKFVKNKITCSIASTDTQCTLGFTDTKICVPKTLLKGNQLKNMISIDAILKKDKDNSKFYEVVYINKDKKEDIYKILSKYVDLEEMNKYN